MPKVILKESRVYRGQHFIEGKPTDVTDDVLKVLKERKYITDADVLTGDEAAQAEVIAEAKSKPISGLVGDVSEDIVNALIAKGIINFEDAQKASDEDLKVPGAGAVTIAKIRELTD